MRGFLIFISIVCGFYIILPDPIPVVIDDIIIFLILIASIKGASNISSSESYESDDDDEDNNDSYERNVTIYNYNTPGRTISLDCSHCGASLELDPDNLIARCPYCDHKILLDTAHLGHFITEHEKTKREQERTIREKEKTERENLRLQYELEQQRLEIEAKERAEKRNNYMMIFGIILLIVFFFILPRILFN